MTAEEMQKLGIPVEYHNEQIFKEAPDLPTVFKVARDLNAYKGNSIRVPGPEAGEADRTEFYGKLKKHAPGLIEIPTDEAKREEALLEHLGVPKDAKEYPAADLPEEVVARLRAEAKEENLTKRQFERRVEREKKAIESSTKAQADAMKGLKTELGAAFEDRLTTAAAASKKLGADEKTVQAIKEGKAPVDSIRTYLNVAKSLGTEPGDLGDHSGNGPKSLTPDEVRGRIGEIFKNPAFMDKAHPQYRDLQDKLLEYNRILYPPE